MTYHYVNKSIYYVNYSNIEEIIKRQPDYRKDVIRQLFCYLSNPGRFSILLTGKNGTGKMHWVNKLFDEIEEKPEYWKKIVQINSQICNTWDLDQWENKFIEANKGILVIRDVELLDTKSQAIVFEFLSTKKGGLYGLNEKLYEIRILFTSTIHLETLKEGFSGVGAILGSKFFDRISQLVLYFPSFHENTSSVLSDFVSVWTALDFPKGHVPKEIESWLEENGSKFFGNFRDLQKLAINWRQYQLMGYNGDRILKIIEIDFFKSLYFPDQSPDLGKTFFVDTSQDYYTVIEKDFRKFVKRLANKQFGKLINAPNKKPFGVPYRSMEGW